MKGILRFAALFAATAAIFSCAKPDSGDGGNTPADPELNENLEFTLKVSETDANSAKIRVEHNGKKEDTWYYFVTTENDIDQAIIDEVARLQKEGDVTLQRSTGKNVTVRNLEEETTYTFIVFGLSSKGEVYGNSADIEFTTSKGEAEFAENAAWTLTYIGDYEQDGQKFTHVVMLESKDENPYFLTAWPKEAFDQTGIKAVAEAEIGSWIEYLSGTQYKFADILSVGNSMDTFADIIDIQYGLEWYIIAIGADAEGNATGHYAISDLVTLVEEDMTPEYEAWLGNWVFTGANGLTQTVTFSKGIANQTFKMTGYEGQADLNVIVLWDAENQCWQINNQNLGTYSFGADGNGDIFFIGEDVEGHLFLDELPICVGGVLEDGTLACLPFDGELEMQDGSTFKFVVNDMLFVAYFASDNSLSYISNTFQTGYPTFPITITPATKASTLSVDKEFKSGINLKKVKTFNIHPSNLTIR